MTLTITMLATQTLAIQECCAVGCGVLFAMPQDLMKRRRDDQKSFYCPNGHAQHYTGKTEEQKLREQLEWAQRDLIRARNNAANIERSRRAYKASLTKLRNRIANGICPVPGCKRSGFSNVRRHIAAKHPQWVHEHPDL